MERDNEGKRGAGHGEAAQTPRQAMEAPTVREGTRGGLEGRENAGELKKEAARPQAVRDAEALRREERRPGTDRARRVSRGTRPSKKAAPVEARSAGSASQPPAQNGDDPAARSVAPVESGRLTGSACAARSAAARPGPKSARERKTRSKTAQSGPGDVQDRENDSQMAAKVAEVQLGAKEGNDAIEDPAGLTRPRWPAGRGTRLEQGRQDRSRARRLAREAVRKRAGGGTRTSASYDARHSPVAREQPGAEGTPDTPEDGALTPRELAGGSSLASGISPRQVATRAVRAVSDARSVLRSGVEPSAADSPEQDVVLALEKGAMRSNQAMREVGASLAKRWKSKGRRAKAGRREEGRDAEIGMDGPAPSAANAAKNAKTRACEVQKRSKRGELVPFGRSGASQGPESPKDSIPSARMPGQRGAAREAAPNVPKNRARAEPSTPRPHHDAPGAALPRKEQASLAGAAPARFENPERQALPQAGRSGHAFEPRGTRGRGKKNPEGATVSTGVGSRTPRQAAMARSPRNNALDPVLGAAATENPVKAGAARSISRKSAAQNATHAARKAAQAVREGMADAASSVVARSADPLRWIWLLLGAGVFLAILCSAGASFVAAGWGTSQAGEIGYLDVQVVEQIRRNVGFAYRQELAARRETVASVLHVEGSRVRIRYNWSDDGAGDGDSGYPLDNWNDVLAIWLVQNHRAISQSDEDAVRSIYFRMNPISATLPGQREEVPLPLDAAEITASPPAGASGIPGNGPAAYLDVRNLRIEDAGEVFGLPEADIDTMRGWISPASSTGQSVFWMQLLGSSVRQGSEYSAGYLNVDPGSAPQVLLQEAQSRNGWIYSQDRRTERGYADCSSLVAACYRAIGVSFGSQWPTAADIGEWCDAHSCRVDAASAQPGDVILWGGRDNGRYLGIYHVALYAGDGMMWEAAPSAGGVTYRAVRLQRPRAILFYARPISAAGFKWTDSSIPPEVLSAGRPVRLSTTAYCEACDTFYAGDPRTASGTIPRRGTVATSRTRQFAFGTRLYIPGYGYGTVEDTGGFADGTIDLYLGHESVCRCEETWGRKVLTVYVLDA